MLTGTSRFPPRCLGFYALQEVRIDGKRVLHKTAPNNERTWRKKFFDGVKGRKRPKGDYQMHVVSDGFEIRLHGATIWGVHAADLAPVAS